MNWKIACILSWVAGCVSCYHATDIRIEPPAPQAVLNALVCPDSVLRVNLSRPESETKRESSEPEQMPGFIDEAEVYLSVNGQPRGRLDKETKAGWYRMASYRPRVGDRLEISARTADYGMVGGETEIPGKTAILSVDTAGRHVVGRYGYEWDDLEISLGMQDIPGERNFYLLTVSPKRIWRKGGRVVNADTLAYGYWPWTKVVPDESSSLENGDMYGSRFINNFYRGFLLTDEGRDGKELTLKFTLSGLEYSYRDDQIECRSSCRISLSSISKSYYMYRRSKALQKEQNDILGEAGLREPIPTYSNVRNGYGLVASRQEVVYELVFPYQATRPPYGNPFAYR